MKFLQEKTLIIHKRINISLIEMFFKQGQK